MVHAIRDATNHCRWEKKTSLEIQGNKIYPDLLGVRGDVPGDWIDGSEKMHEVILSRL